MSDRKMPTTGKALMFQGTGSDVGKSLLVAGLARLFANRGLTVRPFKPQNMSNNAAVTTDGGEIGRAQALQARAARVDPRIDFNPILLKPQSQVGAQVVVHGKVYANARAREFQSMKPDLMPAVVESFERLRAEADLVLVEGAGSASEVNLRANDIANMGFARQADVPVVLIGDIERGGVIASLVGTKTVIDAADAELIMGFIVNRMRGDASLFDDGIKTISENTGWTALGVVPHFEDAARLPAEDAMALQDAARWSPERPDAATTRIGRTVKIAVPVLPRISNFDDLDPLRLEPDVDLALIEPGTAIPGDIDLVVLPGSKATIADMAVLRRQGWDIDIKAHARRGGAVVGLCGGYQMLGQTISDPDQIEGRTTQIDGLGLLEVETVLTAGKSLQAVTGHTLADNKPVTGYEMHVGQTTGNDAARPLIRFEGGRTDGAVSENGRISGSYVHGLFSNDQQRRAWIDRLKGADRVSDKDVGMTNYHQMIDDTLDALADHLEHHLDVDELLKLAR